MVKRPFELFYIGQMQFWFYLNVCAIYVLFTLSPVTWILPTFVNLAQSYQQMGDDESRYEKTSES